eukprot:4092004-Amphidinium_carterae.2
MCSRIRTHVQAYTKQDGITYGSPDYIVEVEVDEVTICRYARGDAEKPISWLGYVGMIERGVPSSLKLVQLPIRNTVLRAPGPGPLTIADWLPMARK